jgi:hypothetical protein
MEPEGSLPCSQDPTTGPILSQINPVHNFPSYFPNIHSNIILPSTPRSSELSLPLGSPIKLSMVQVFWLLSLCAFMLNNLIWQHACPFTLQLQNH